MLYIKSKYYSSIIQEYLKFMRPNLYIFLLLILAEFASAQNTAIKIYLEDAETGKNISDAVVKLEGFEIPEIIGIYDTSGKYYYFNEIPAGYSTVMAYHKKYNEKGFQDTIGLPSTLNLRLYYIENVSYPFERPALTHVERDYTNPDLRIKKLWKVLEKHDKIRDDTFRYIYAEDPYHIAIISKYNSQDFLNNTLIADVLEKYSLVAANSLSRAVGNSGFKCYGFDMSGNFFSKDTGPGFNGCDAEMGYETTFKVYFFNKKDKTKFSRYNSPEIAALRKLNLIVAALTVRRIEYFAAKPFDFKKFYNAGSLFRINDTQQDIDEYYEFGAYPPVQVFFSNARKDNKAEFGKLREKKIYDNHIDYNVNGLYFVVPKTKSAALGLGGLEIMESGNNDFVFFNIMPKEFTIKQ